jgi:hypothetical protein
MDWNLVFHIGAWIVGLAGTALAFYVKGVAKGQTDQACGELRDDFNARVAAIDAAYQARLSELKQEYAAEWAALVVKHDQLDARVDNLRERVTKAEGEIETATKVMATGKDVGKLAVEVAEVGGEVKAVTRAVDGMTDQLKGLSGIVQDIQQYMLSNK